MQIHLCDPQRFKKIHMMDFFHGFKKIHDCQILLTQTTSMPGSEIWLKNLSDVMSQCLRVECRVSGLGGDMFNVANMGVNSLEASQVLWILKVHSY